MTRRILAVCLLLLVPTPVLAAPPTDEQMRGLVEKVRAAAAPTDGSKPSVKSIRETIDNNLGDVPVAEASLAQIEMLTAPEFFVGSQTLSAALLPRLTELAKQPGRDGARAAELRIAFFTPYSPPADSKQSAKAVSEWYMSVRPVVVAALKHPGAVDLIKSGKGGFIFARVGGSPAEIVKVDRLLELVDPLLLPEMSLDTAGALGDLVMKVVDPQVGLEKAQQRALLDKIAAAADGALARPVVAGQERLAQAVRETSLRARSPALRGELIGNTAPNLAFTWCSDEKLKSLSEAKGSVVLVGFWATIYKPTMQNFPLLRQLMARYREAGSPVRIISVTSPQGVHMKWSPDPAARPQRIDCTGDPKKEYAAMAELMTDLGVTWTVAFTQEGVYNPSFGVVGIPHFALIDASGKVRENELRPGTPADIKALADKIDAMLKEAGLPVPPEPMTPPTMPTPVAPGGMPPATSAPSPAK